MKSAILDEFGVGAEKEARWEPPKGNSAYFGWIDFNNFNTLKVENVQAICPLANRNDRYQVVLQYGTVIQIPAADTLRLMQRMGWTEPKGNGRTM